MVVGLLPRNTRLFAPDGVGSGSGSSDGVAQVRAALQSCYQANKGDCSGFLKAVMDQLGNANTGDPMANDFAARVRAGSDGWTKLAGSAAAEQCAADGQLVIGALEGRFSNQTHGHVVIVVPGDGPYPTAWWGSLGGQPGQNKTINWAWTHQALPNVVFGAQDLPG
jgi:hypothetical protein